MSVSLTTSNRNSVKIVSAVTFNLYHQLTRVRVDKSFSMLTGNDELLTLYFWKRQCCFLICQQSDVKFTSSTYGKLLRKFACLKSRHIFIVPSVYNGHTHLLSKAPTLRKFYWVFRDTVYQIQCGNRCRPKPSFSVGTLKFQFSFR